MIDGPHLCITLASVFPPRMNIFRARPEEIRIGHLRYPDDLPIICQITQACRDAIIYFRIVMVFIAQQYPFFPCRKSYSRENRFNCIADNPRIGRSIYSVMPRIPNKSNQESLYLLFTSELSKNIWYMLFLFSFVNGPIFTVRENTGLFSLPNSG